MKTPVLPGGFPENETHQDTGLAELAEECDVDSENLPLIVKLEEYKRRQVYDEFWGDLCWTGETESDPSPNGR